MMPVKLEVSKNIIWERGEKKSNFVVEKPDKHYDSQEIKININNGKSC